jgi:hypothetical protein
MKITIAGNAGIVKTTITSADFEAVKKGNPSALKITEEKTELFYIGYSQNGGAINSFGIIFNGTSEDGSLSVTIGIPADITDKKEFLVQKLLPVKDYLEKLEETVPEIAAKLRREKAALIAKITVL